jgi:hypothetical protein
MTICSALRQKSGTTNALRPVSPQGVSSRFYFLTSSSRGHPRFAMEASGRELSAHEEYNIPRCHPLPPRKRAFFRRTLR